MARSIWASGAEAHTSLAPRSSGDVEVARLRLTTSCTSASTSCSQTATAPSWQFALFTPRRPTSTSSRTSSPGQSPANNGKPALLARHRRVSTFEEMRDEAPTYLETLVQAPRMTSLHQGVVSLWSELRHALGAQIDAMKREQRLPSWVEPASMARCSSQPRTLDPTGPPLSAMAAQFARLLLTAGS